MGQYWYTEETSSQQFIDKESFTVIHWFKQFRIVSQQHVANTGSLLPLLFLSSCTRFNSNQSPWYILNETANTSHTRHWKKYETRTNLFLHRGTIKVPEYIGTFLLCDLFHYHTPLLVVDKQLSTLFERIVVQKHSQHQCIHSPPIFKKLRLKRF